MKILTFGDFHDFHVKSAVKEDFCLREGRFRLHEAGSVLVKAGASLQSEVKEEV